jgi:hypothetical protein
MPHVLIILTSQGIIPATRQKTGWHLVRFVPVHLSPTIPHSQWDMGQQSELAHPYSILEPKVKVTIASPQGGEAPLDPASSSASKRPEPEADGADMVSRARQWEAWSHTYAIREMVSRAGAGEFDAVFYVGGRGGMYVYVYVTIYT